MQIEIQSPIDEETVAAIVAAVRLLLLQAHSVPPAVASPSAWAMAGIRDNHAAQVIDVQHSPHRQSR